MPPKVRDIIALLREEGWVQIGQKGSHGQFRRPQRPGRVTVNGHPGDDLHHALYKSILRQAGLKS